MKVETARDRLHRTMAAASADHCFLAEGKTRDLLTAVCMHKQLQAVERCQALQCLHPRPQLLATILLIIVSRT